MANNGQIIGRPRPTMNIKFEELERVECGCGGETFMPLFECRRIPAFMSPDGTPGTANKQVGFVCAQCGTQYSVARMAQKPEETLVATGGEVHEV